MRHLTVLLLTLAAPSLRAQASSFPSLIYATVQVAGTPRNLLLDLQVPAGAGPFPVVAWIHGGGWQSGSRLPVPATATRLLARGYAVASIDYRLSGAAIWPAQIHDCKAAIRYVRANAATFGLDPNRIAVMGSSAGGHLVAALSTMGDVGTVRSGTFVVDLEGTVGPHLGTSSRVQACVAQFGPTNMLHAHDLPTFDHDSASSPESLLVGGAIQTVPERWATVDPISFLSPDDAPMLLMHGTDDTVVPFHQSQMLLDAATAIGHDATLFAVQNNGHGGPGFLAPDATAAIDAFLDSRLRDLPTTVVSVTASDASAAENGDTATFVVARTGSTAAPLMVTLVLGGDCEPFADCEPMPALLTIPAGQASATMTFSPRDDALVEGTETAALHIGASLAYRIDASQSRAFATLSDDDSAAALPVVTFLALDEAASEAAGNPGAVDCVRTGPTTAALTVGYEIRGSATQGSDYAALAGTATIPAGSSSVAIVVQPLQDFAPEASETVVLQLLAGSTYVRGTDSTAHVVIADDDRGSALPIVSVLATEPTIAEPLDSGTFSITRTGATNVPLTVRLGSTGTATPSLDFAPLPTAVVIPAGSAWVRLPVIALDDNTIEPMEDVVLTVVPDAAYSIGRAGAKALWLGDDDAPAPAASAIALAIGPLEPGRTATATIVGGAPFGLHGLWLSLLPAHVALPPFGTVQIDLVFGSEFATGTLDNSGAAIVPLAVPLSSAFTGIDTYWQSAATTTIAPFVELSPARRRRVLAPPPF